jgi:hypothetical protein
LRFSFKKIEQQDAGQFSLDTKLQTVEINEALLTPGNRPDDVEWLFSRRDCFGQGSVR